MTADQHRWTRWNIVALVIPHRRSLELGTATPAKVFTRYSEPDRSPDAARQARDTGARAPARLGVADLYPSALPHFRTSALPRSTRASGALWPRGRERDEPAERSGQGDQQEIPPARTCSPLSKAWTRPSPELPHRFAASPPPMLAPHDQREAREHACYESCLGAVGGPSASTVPPRRASAVCSELALPLHGKRKQAD